MTDDAIEPFFPDGSLAPALDLPTLEEGFTPPDLTFPADGLPEMRPLVSDVPLPLEGSGIGDAAMQLYSEYGDKALAAAKAVAPKALGALASLGSLAAAAAPVAAVAATAAGAGYLGYKLGERLVATETAQNMLAAVAPTGSKALTIAELEKSAIARGKPAFTSEQKAKLRARGIADFDFDDNPVYQKSMYSFKRDSKSDLERARTVIAGTSPLGRRHPALWAYSKLVAWRAPGAIANLPVRALLPAFERMTEDGGGSLLKLTDAAREYLNGRQPLDFFKQPFRKALERFLESIEYMKTVVDNPDKALASILGAVTVAAADAEKRYRARFNAELMTTSLDSTEDGRGPSDLAEFLCLADECMCGKPSMKTEVRYFSLGKAFKKVAKKAVPVLKIAVPVLAGVVGTIYGGPIGAALASSFASMLVNRLGGGDQVPVTDTGVDTGALLVDTLAKAASRVPGAEDILTQDGNFQPIPITFTGDDLVSLEPA